MRSRKLAVLQSCLTPPPVYGESKGDLLIVGWGSTKGAIEEAVDRARAEGLKVSSLHLRFLSPLEPGLKEIFSAFKKVMTVEINYSDEDGRPVHHRGEPAARPAWPCCCAPRRSWTWTAGRACRASRFAPGSILDAIRGRMPRGGAA